MDYRFSWELDTWSNGSVKNGVLTELVYSKNTLFIPTTKTINEGLLKNFNWKKYDSRCISIDYKNTFL